MRRDNCIARNEVNTTRRAAACGFEIARCEGETPSRQPAGRRRYLLFSGSNIETHLRAVEGIQGAIDIDRSVSAGEALLGTVLSFLGSLYVDLGWTLSGLSENRHLVGKNFREAPSHGKALLGGVLAERDLADGEFGDEWRMPGKNSQISVLAGNLGFLGRGLDHLLFRRDDLELESIGQSVLSFQFSVLSQTHPLRTDPWPLTPIYAAAFIFSAASSTSSIGPFI
jgi:hypothetical protein